MILYEANSTAGILWRPAADQKLQSAFFWRVASHIQEELPKPDTQPKLEQGESDLKNSDPDAFNQAAESVLQKMARTAVCSQRAS